ncbi:hypothetical protein [Blastococcus brunescens]|uniref:Uncharacterized protein n=1 Tax=Blastococcus brunescens TaxID=1564165 RepID=A0ABZ1AX84_9ACTN|nr:hypothetical protein [Blastococcus sp. BMG 8361]WRL62003.1 hypothetical protein U6N30_18160 [Blastococcus sp. BMG 8361]
MSRTGAILGAAAILALGGYAALPDEGPEYLGDFPPRSSSRRRRGRPRRARTPAPQPVARRPLCGDPQRWSPRLRRVAAERPASACRIPPSTPPGTSRPARRRGTTPCSPPSQAFLRCSRASSTRWRRSPTAWSTVSSPCPTAACSTA